MILSIASGKGGTGKTTVATNMAKSLNTEIALLDCDVEEPNAHLFLKGKTLNQETVTIPIPQVDESKCNACGICSQFCRFNAIVSLKTKPLIFPELCHSCGGCMKMCPQNAISETNQRIGVIETKTVDLISLIYGRLDVGVAMAPPLIRAVKKCLKNYPLAILDAPPGTSCPVITSIRGSDFVLLVTEPTPFGLHDLTLAVEMVRELEIPFGVMVNRLGAGDHRIHKYCNDQKIPIVGELNDDRRIAEIYSKGQLIVDALPEYKITFKHIFQACATLAKKNDM